MACANWLLTIAAVLIFGFAVWPGWGGVVATNWVVGISAIVVLIVAWTGVRCRYCECAAEAVEKSVAKKATKKKKKK
ncbi:MAG: hypothetical protein ABH864_07060 [archaeon]